MTKRSIMAFQFIKKYKVKILPNKKKQQTTQAKLYSCYQLHLQKAERVKIWEKKWHKTMNLVMSALSHSENYGKIIQRATWKSPRWEWRNYIKICCFFRIGIILNEITSARLLSFNIWVMLGTSIETVSVFISIPYDSGMFKGPSVFNSKYLSADSMPGILLGSAFELSTMLSRNWISN